MKNIKTIIYFITLIFLFTLSCKKKDTNQLEKRIAIEVADYIIEKDSLKKFSYSSDMYIHINSNKLNENHFKTFVSFNGLKPEFNDSEFEKINVNGFETFIYYTFELNDSFYIPDSKSHNFLIEYYDDEIILNELSWITKKDESIEELEDLDF